MHARELARNGLPEDDAACLPECGDAWSIGGLLVIPVEGRAVFCRVVSGREDVLDSESDPAQWSDHFVVDALGVTSRSTGIPLGPGFDDLFPRRDNAETALYRRCSGPFVRHGCSPV